MLELYFGNVPSSLSTILFIVFCVYFIMTVRKPQCDKKWKKAAIVTVLTGTLMSALSGIKDTVADKAAVSFEQMNPALAVLCALGLMAVLSGVAAAICRNEKINKVIFFILSSIIIAKTVIVEVLRIGQYLSH